MDLIANLRAFLDEHELPFVAGQIQDGGASRATIIISKADPPFQSK
jgi:hypothetical protein